MKKAVKDALLGTLLALVFASIAYGSSIYTWSNGEVLTASRLNANFAHIHGSMVGGHGARLVDADVSASAAISRSKIAAYQALPIAWAKVGAATTVCSADPCTVADGYGVSGVAFSSTGTYTVTTSATLDAEVGIVVSAMTASRNCRGIVLGANTITVACENYSSAANNSVFTIAVFN